MRIPRWNIWKEGPQRPGEEVTKASVGKKNKKGGLLGRAKDWHARRSEKKIAEQRNRSPGKRNSPTKGNLWKAGFREGAYNGKRAAEETGTMTLRDGEYFATLFLDVGCIGGEEGQHWLSIEISVGKRRNACAEPKAVFQENGAVM